MVWVYTTLIDDPFNSKAINEHVYGLHAASCFVVVVNIVHDTVYHINAMR